MSRITTSESRRRGAQSGFTLAGVIVIMTVMMVFIAYTVPRQWSKIMARERDRQTIFAMKQYARSILEFQKKHGGLPTSLDQLQDARKPRFMRGVEGKIPDPLTGEVDWILIPPSAATGGPPPTMETAGLRGNRQDDARPTPTPSTTPSPNQEASKPAGNKDYVGPFVGVRPNKTGKSFLTVNNSDNYEDWSYTVQDLTAELNARAASVTVK